MTRCRTPSAQHVRQDTLQPHLPVVQPATEVRGHLNVTEAHITATPFKSGGLRLKLGALVVGGDAGIAEVFACGSRVLAGNRASVAAMAFERSARGQEAAFAMAAPQRRHGHATHCGGFADREKVDFRFAHNRG